ncbi:efflux RND transporter periplasmic adaptor subunit [Dinoroseobacter sp. S124A]|uniref:efflux RND transporter periplasmic adaptor subunit n=1 Tax=Dinoroseobacter sp. S124A TaxID=3415128 RepID=UPI003C7D53ED
MSRLFSLLRDAFWLVVSVALVAGGYLGFQYLGATRDIVEAQPVERPVALVATQPLMAYDTALPVRGEGFITPFRQVALSAQIQGRITDLDPAIDARGSFAAGDVLVRLDDRAAEAALDQTDANIASTQARLDLVKTQLERGETLRERGVIAQEALDQLTSQRQELMASLDSLRAARETADVTLDNARITAPFAGRVLRKTAEIGAVVSPGQEIAVIYTDDALEVTVPLRQADAALIPGLFEGAQVPAEVEARFAGQVYRWGGEVTRVETALDTRTRSLNVTVRLLDAEGVPDNAQGGLPSGAPPALINAFAHVTISGAEVAGAYAIPSTAFRDGALWLYVDGVLNVVPADLIHVDGEDSYVRVGALPAGAELVTSPLDTVVVGMPLRRAETARRTAALTE